ncbi:MAG: S41 family peptidase [Candidatus Moranbacteria bacterium]|nr:S41 family peptidase [Candidatus Moranbacteria bacterium]
MKTKRILKIVGYVFAFVFILVSIFSAGVYFGYSNRPYVEKVSGVDNKDVEVETNADFEPFWKAWNILKEKSIYANDTKDQDRVWGAISGLAASFGDPYTIFLPPKENESFKEEIKGSFEGIGAELGTKDDLLTIIAPLKNTPAERAGIKAGDKIIEIDGKSTINISADDAVSLIRGPRGTSVKLTILRPGEKSTRDITVERDEIEIPTIETNMRDDGIFVIKFYSFSENATSLFKKALIEFVDEKTNKLVIDLRGNPGGYLDSAIRIASWFIDEGDIVLKEDNMDGSKQKDYRSYGPRLFNNNLKLVVLVDEGSASASEILAGALKSHKIATLVGEKTFGKGSVQELVKLTDDTSLKITVANWLTPDGISISKQGITPDVVVKMTSKDEEAGKDPQMEKAIEILNQ